MKVLEIVHKYGRGQLVIWESKNPTFAIGCQCTDAPDRTLKHVLYFCLHVQETDVTPSRVTHGFIVHKGEETLVCKTLYPPAGNNTHC